MQIALSKNGDIEFYENNRLVTEPSEITRLKRNYEWKSIVHSLSLNLMNEINSNIEKALSYHKKNSPLITEDEVKDKINSLQLRTYSVETYKEKSDKELKNDAEQAAVSYANLNANKKIYPEGKLSREELIAKKISEFIEYYKTIDEDKKIKFDENQQQLKRINDREYKDEYGIQLHNTNKFNSYETKILNNKEVGITSIENDYSYFIQCNISNNEISFLKFENANGYESFINCTFNNNKDLIFNDYKKDLQKIVSKDKENKKVFSSAFELQTEIQNKIDSIHQTSKNISNVNILFDAESINIIYDCISKIIKQIGLSIFNFENENRLLSLCKDFYPGNENEINFIKELCEKKILEMIATKQMSDDFDERLHYVCKKYMDEKDVNVFEDRIKQIFE